MHKYPVRLILAAYILALVLLFALLFAMQLPVELLGVMVVPAILAAVLYPRRVYITMAVLLILHAIVGIAWLAPDPRTSYIGLVIFTAAWSAVAEILRALVAMQRRTETKLRESEERYRLLVENQGEGGHHSGPARKLHLCESSGRRNLWRCAGWIARQEPARLCYRIPVHLL